MGVHSLVTGLNGAGKTLYTVATKLKPLSSATIKYGPREVPRRLVVGGIPALLIDHEIMDIQEIDPETWTDRYRNIERAPGSPPVKWLRAGRDGVFEAYWPAEGEEPGDTPGVEPLVYDACSWWLWCMPGDVLVIDECQRLFRPMASGRRVPRFIARLETARHYGIEFIYLTQHPNLLHSNVRNLVGPHEDVRRIFGSGRVMVYQWDKCSNPDRIAKATGRIWKHDKSAFNLYKSSQLHTKFGQRLPIAVWAVLVGLVVLCYLGWMLEHRLKHRFGDDPVVSKAAAAASSPAGGQSFGGQASGRAAVGGGQGGPLFPVIAPAAFRIDHEPYDGRGIEILGGYQVGDRAVQYFGLTQDGKRLATVTLADLVKAGYAYTVIGPCSGLLRYAQLERVVSCPDKVDAVDHSSGARPGGAASSPFGAA